MFLSYQIQSLVLSKRCVSFLLNHSINKHIFFGGLFSCFQRDSCLNSGHDRYNCIIYTDDDENYFPSYSNLTL